MSARRRQREDAGNGETPRMAVLLSLALHLAITAALVLATARWLTTEIVAAGPGEGGEGGGGAIDVGVSDPSAILGFAKPQPIANIGDHDNAINNAKAQDTPP